MHTPVGLFRGAIHLLAPLTANCRTFHEKWTGAANVPPPSGRWAGEWRSLSTGHSGPLRCVLEVQDDRRWRATFHAGYARVFRACYATSLAVARRGDHWTFSGRSDLGRLAGGLYEHDGEVTDQTLRSRYRSATEHGEFTLRRQG